MENKILLKSILDRYFEFSENVESKYSIKYTNEVLDTNGVIKGVSDLGIYRLPSKNDDKVTETHIHVDDCYSRVNSPFEYNDIETLIQNLNYWLQCELKQYDCFKVYSEVPSVEITVLAKDKITLAEYKFIFTITTHFQSVYFNVNKFRIVENPLRSRMTVYGEHFYYKPQVKKKFLWWEWWSDWFKTKDGSQKYTSSMFGDCVKYIVKHREV